MKIQKLVSSFWLASTAAVCIIQPATAATVQITAVQIKPTAGGVEVLLKTPKNTFPQVFTSSDRQTFVADILNTQLRLKAGKTFHAANPTDGITGITVKPLNGKNIRVTVTAKAGVPVGKIMTSDSGLVLTLKEEGAGSGEQRAGGRKKPSSRLPVSFKKGEQRAESNGCKLSRFPAAENCNQRLTGKTPAPVAQSAPPATPASPAPPASPNYLNSNPNPLQFPTLPAEVRIDVTQPLTLQQVYELARRNNLEIQESQLALERSRAAVREAQAALFPDLSLTTGINNQGLDVFSNTASEQNELFRQQGREGASLNTTALSGTVSLNYDLYTSGTRRSRIRAAEEQERFQQLDLERRIEQLRLDVATDYYGLQSADEQVRIQRSAVTNAQASLRDAQALEQAGVGTRFDVLQAQVDLADANQRLTEALSQQRIARRRLVTRLNLSQSASITAADPVAIAGLWNLSLEDSIVLAFRNRAELEQLLAQRNIGEQNRRAALGTLGPQVSLTGRYQANETFEDNEDPGDQYSVAANLSLNLFDGGAARARARQARAEIETAENNFASQRNNIRFEVEQAYSELEANFQSIQTASVALEQARESLRLARLRFQAGVGTQTDVINQQDALTRAEGNRVNAIIGYNRALAQLQRAISSGQRRR